MIAIGWYFGLVPTSRIVQLAIDYPRGTRRRLFETIAPGDLDRLLRGVPDAEVRTWFMDADEDDSAAFAAYVARTRPLERERERIFDSIRPAVNVHAYDLEELTRVPRLLGDPVDTHGVRLYMRCEALPDYGGAMFEKTVPVVELLPYLRKQQARGYAPFIALHDVRYGDTRKSSNVWHPRVVIADFDDKHGQIPPWQLLDRVPPDLIVRSGGGFHCYWVIALADRSKLDVAYVMAVIKGLARVLGSV